MTGEAVGLILWMRSAMVAGRGDSEDVMDKRTAYGLLEAAAAEILSADLLGDECMDPRDCTMGRGGAADYRCAYCALVFAVDAVAAAREGGR